MSEVEEWQDAAYTEIYNEELRGLERRRKNDSECTIDKIEGLLHHLYIRDGQNWEGRGQLGDIVISATIAAYEAFITAWKAESQTDSAH